MENLRFIFTILYLLSGSFIFGQTQVAINDSLAINISGKVTDQVSGEPILFGAVILYQNEVLLQGTETDLDGNYSFTVHNHGTYDIEVSYVGYQTQLITGIKVDSTHEVVNITLNEGVELTECVIMAFKEPLIDYNNTISGGSVTAEQIRSLPTKNITAIAATTAGISVVDSRDISVRGSRTNGSYYYLDGVKVSGNTKTLVPQSEIIQTEITLGGTDASKECQTPKVNESKVETDKKLRDELKMNTEEYSKIIENKFINPKDEALSTFSIDVDRASYSNVRRMINNHQMPPPDAVRIEEMINYFPYEYEAPTGNVPFNVENNLTDCPWNSKHQILHIGIQGIEIVKEELPATNLVFLIDVSGSMQTWNKLELVKSSLNLLVDNMREQDQIALVVYAGAGGIVLESTSGKDKQTIKEAIYKLTAGGSTAGGAGINLAYKVAKENFIKGGNNRVMLATDGDFNIGVSDEGSLVRMIEEKREEDIFLSILGYGMGNYKDSKMQKLANSGNGNHSYIDNIDEAKKTLIDEFGGTLFTIAKDVKIQIEFNPEFVKSYKLIGYENRLLDKQDFNDDKKDAGELGAGHTVTAFYEIEPQTTFGRQTTSVDELKYQELQSANNKSDLATIKLRYKKPIGTKSKLIEQIITPEINTIISTDLQFALCVAEFGMLLRGSRDLKGRNYKELLVRSKTLIDQDNWGYKSDFISMLENVITINENL